jgi:plastocyanin
MDDRMVVPKIDDFKDKGSSSHTNSMLDLTAVKITTDKTKYVSIVRGAAYVGNKAFSPNPMNIKVGYTITWTNNDIETHTITSGLGFNSPDIGKKFDSGMMENKQTFSYMFDIDGEFSYFCQFHPTMVGKVIVK